MAVNGELLVYPGQELTPQDFAIMMERISVIQSGILSGCTIAFSETASNTLNVAAGYVFIKGRLVKVNEGTLDTSSLSASATSWFVYAELHLNGELIVEEPVSVYASDTTQRNADTENFNVNNSGYATAVLATINPTSKEIKQITTPEIGVEEFFTLTANGWETITYPGVGVEQNIKCLVYNLADPRFTNDAHIELVPAAIQFNYPYLRALQTANLQVFSMEGGVLKIGCYGQKPTIDLEIGIIFRGNL